jgi:hypothetical protein
MDLAQSQSRKEQLSRDIAFAMIARFTAAFAGACPVFGHESSVTKPFHSVTIYADLNVARSKRVAGKTLQQGAKPASEYRPGV